MSNRLILKMWKDLKNEALCLIFESTYLSECHPDWIEGFRQNLNGFDDMSEDEFESGEHRERYSNILGQAYVLRSLSKDLGIELNYEIPKTSS